ncbi:replicative DNA helicase [[Clostridium] aminophilum]|uniref:Replicative DNA helicase n=1 Tax=[Clostridium] aminophilum TaxID=1526 RepID=A0A1I0FBS0_9FIRM|nr:replicative DNA helicase [[Clostridium] aminophilum]SET55305.1 replicative DNA helicase [[Clostridium] aminophilum]
MAAEDALVKRVLPNSVDAERSVIGSMLMDKEAIMAAAETVTGADFYQQQYGIMFDTIVELFESGKPVDIVTVQNRLKEKNVPPEVASLEFVRDIMKSVPTSVNAKAYAEIVYEKSVLRKLIRMNEEIENLCYAGKDTLDEILDHTEKSVFDVLEKKTTGELVPISDVALNVLDKIEKASKSTGTVTGIPSGFIDLDYRTSGFQPSDLVLIAARPSMGKTAFVLNVVQHVAIKKNLPCLVFSLEMSKEQLINRVLSMQSMVDSQKLRTGDLNDSDWDAVVEGIGVIGNSKIMIDDTPGISFSEMRSKCRKIKLEYGISIIIIDYLQLMSGSGKGHSAESRQQEISEISRSLKALARELNVPVLALSQLSRACEQRPDHRPMMSDLRDSGAIEQDADVIMFLYRDDYYNKATEKPNVAEVIIAKQRNGPIGTVELMWKPELTKFVNMERQPRDGGV